MQKTIEVSKIYSSSNIRDEKDTNIQELMDSIESYGLIEPIAVRKNGDRFEVIAGHRRLEAVRRLGEPFIECNILEDVSDKDRLMLQITENIQRKDMSAYELVKVFDEMKDKFHLTDRQISVALGKHTTWVSENRYAVKLLEQAYKNGDIPEDKKKMTSAEVKYCYKDKKKKIESISLEGRGFSLRQKSHSYIFYCSEIEFENELNALIKKYS